MKVITLAALVLAGASALAAQEPVYKAGENGVKHPQVVFEKKSTTPVGATTLLYDL